MLLRDASGKINIISKTSYDTESAYNEQIYRIFYTYTKMYKTVFEYDLFEYNNKQYSLNNNLDKDKDNISDDEY